MRVTLIHNPTAGEEEHSRAVLVRAIQSAGYQVTYRSSKKEFKRILRQPTDLVAVAGGDGTVSKVARQLIGRSVPLTILPMGVANNIALSLGISGSVEQLIAGWNSAAPLEFRVGKLSSPWGEPRFFESVGFGLFAELMQEADSKNSEPGLSRFVQLQGHVRNILRMARNHHPRDWKLEIDGQDVSGRYLLFEAMHIRSIGPNLHLAPTADPRDPYLEVVTVTEDHREQLLDYLSRRLEKHTSSSDLPTRRARRLRLRWDGRPFHIDDVMWPKKERKPGVDLEIRVGDDAVRFAIPRP